MRASESTWGSRSRQFRSVFDDHNWGAGYSLCITVAVVLGEYTIASLLLPAALGPPANAFRLPASTPTDVFAAWWLPLTERLSAGTVWMLGIAASVALLLVPRFVRRPREHARVHPVVRDPGEHVGRDVREVHQRDEYGGRPGAGE